VTAILREDVLDGRLIALAGPGRDALREPLAALGADVRALDVDLADDAATDAAAAALGPVQTLVVDAAAAFTTARGEDDELAALRAAVDGAWAACRAVASVAWIAHRRPGKIVLVAPAPGDGAHAEAARAALENLARTLSIEWSRYGIRPTAITPGATPAGDVATLCAYLASPAGDYFSGTRLELT
jgi:NAD(P)-dependent dehydrogenase (short-subunit alcohol dehydrogenase family)